MNSAVAEPRPWSRRWFWSIAGFIFLVQIGLLFWLGDNSPGRMRPPARRLNLKLAGDTSAELQSLHDPTLFALPHPQRASTPAWLSTPAPEFHPFAWPEPTNYMLIATDQLGSSFNRFVETNNFSSLPPPASPRPVLIIPQLAALPLSAEHSTVRFEWDQARRRLLTPFDLRSWESPSFLTNSVVQIVVGADGTPVSVTLLSGCGFRAADQEALAQANAARFEPLNRDVSGSTSSPAAQLSWGRMIFRWHTVPPSPTNAPKAKP
jgi:TonB family protein